MRSIQTLSLWETLEQEALQDQHNIIPASKLPCSLPFYNLRLKHVISRAISLCVVSFFFFSSLCFVRLLFRLWTTSTWNLKREGKDQDWVIFRKLGWIWKQAPSRFTGTRMSLKWLEVTKAVAEKVALAGWKVERICGIWPFEVH